MVEPTCYLLCLKNLFYYLSLELSKQVTRLDPPRVDNLEGNIKYVLARLRSIL